MSFSYEYMLIRQHYGQDKAKRSGVPLLRHIDEGLAILSHLGAGSAIKAAWCLHPLVQSDEMLEQNFDRLAENVHGERLMLAMEYRNQANRWLSDKVQRGEHRIIWREGVPTPGPIQAVKLMLIADKVQNYKDFDLHHLSRHPRSDELTVYFKAWHDALGLSAEDLRVLRAVAVAAPSPHKT